MRLVDCALVLLGLIAVGVGFLSLDDWIDVLISAFVWGIGIISLAVGMRPILRLIRIKFTPWAP